MTGNKLFVRRENGIAVLNFDLVDVYSIHPTRVSFNLHVKLKDESTDVISIHDISDQLSFTDSGIYYEIKKICWELNKHYIFALPNWMKQVDTY